MRTISVLCIGVALFLTAPALAAVDLEVTLSTKARGTISPAGEVESFRFEATTGTVVTLSVSGKGLDLEVTLLDPAGDLVDIKGAAGFQDRGSKVILKKFVLGSTGAWTLRITSTETGTYSLRLKGKAAKKTSETVAVTAGGSAVIGVSAPVGSSVTLKAKAAKGSVAEPRFGTFDGQDLSDAGKFSTKGHTVKLADVTGGDLDVEVKNLGAADGDVTVRITVKAPKAEKLKLDVTAEELGGGETAVGRIVDAAGGGQVAVDDETSSIDGASVTVGAGALDEKTTITVASAPAIDLEDDEQAAGPAVAFGPEGLTFSAPVTLTLPYNPALLPASAETGDIRVLHVKAKGNPETLVPTAVDEKLHELTVQTSSFSRFMPIVPPGPPNLAARTYWELFMDFDFEVDLDGDDSRERFIFSGTGTVTLGTEGTNESKWTTTEEELVWGHDGEDRGKLEWSRGTDTGTLRWDFLPGNTRMRVTSDEGEEFDFAIGANGSVLMGGSDADSDDSLSTVVLLIEKSKTAPTLSSIAGDFLFIEYGIEPAGAPNPLDIATWRSVGTVSLKANGTYVFQGEERSFEYDAGSGDTFVEFESTQGGDAWRIAGPESGLFEDAVILTETGDGGDESERFFLPSADGNILMSLKEGHLILAVRRSAGMTAARVAGDFEIRGYDVGLRSYVGTNGTLGDLEVINLGGSVTAKANGTLSFLTVSERLVTRDGGVSGGVRIETETEAGTEKFNVGPNGDITIAPGKEPTIGAVTPDGEFIIAYDDPKNDVELVGIVLLLKKSAAGGN